MRIINDDFLDYTRPQEDIKPTTNAPVIFGQGVGAVSFQDLRWGFKKWDGNGVIINARAETLETKDMFSRLLAVGRCVVPASEYYEWKNKAKHLIKDKDGNLLFMAGLYREGEKGREFVIITKDAEGDITDIHDRMPVILHASQVEDWLIGKLSPDEVVKHMFNAQVEPCDGEMVQLDIFGN